MGFLPESPVQISDSQHLTCPLPGCTPVVVNVHVGAETVAALVDAGLLELDQVEDRDAIGRVLDSVIVELGTSRVRATCAPERDGYQC